MDAERLEVVTVPVFPYCLERLRVFGSLNSDGTASTIVESSVGMATRRVLPNFGHRTQLR